MIIGVRSVRPPPPSQLLAGAKVTDVDNHQRGVLHMAVEGDFPTILSVLLENSADPDLVDEGGNNGTSCDCHMNHVIIQTL